MEVIKTWPCIYSEGYKDQFQSGPSCNFRGSRTNSQIDDILICIISYITPKNILVSTAMIKSSQGNGNIMEAEQRYDQSILMNEKQVKHKISRSADIDKF